MVSLTIFWEVAGKGLEERVPFSISYEVAELASGGRCSKVIHSQAGGQAGGQTIQMLAGRKTAGVQVCG